MRRNLLFIMLSGLFFFSCTKQKTEISTGAKRENLIISAQTYFNNVIRRQVLPTNTSNYRARQSKSVLWDQAIVKHLTIGEAVIIPISYKNNLFIALNSDPNKAYKLKDLSRLVIIKDQFNSFHAYVFTFIPDSGNYNTTPKGLAILEDWHGNSLAKPIYTGSWTSKTSAPKTSTLQSKEIESYINIETCIEIDGYNYSSNDPDDGEYWSETSCTTYGYFVADALVTDISPTDISTLTSVISTSSYQLLIAPPANPITNIADYLKCFTNGSLPDHTYSVQVCIDQPEPGTREAWGVTNGGSSGTSAAGTPVNTGHTFLVLNENSQGYIISRSVGFYPSGFIAPKSGFQATQGILNNDQSHTYNICLTINVSSAQFFNILNYVSLGNNTGFYYNLNTNNCTTFVLNAMSAGGVSLPSTRGSWPGGSGYDPGDLGEDVRKMPLTNKMTRNTVDNPHPNTGFCE